MRTHNVAASVRARLLQLAKNSGQDFNLTLNRYAIERLLYRLSVSPHATRFVLKGATLFALWMDAPHRPTRDLDLLGYNNPSIERLEATFRDLCTQEVEADGLEFFAQSVRGQTIREEAIYDGVRMLLEVELAGARLGLQVDIGFGDALASGVQEVEFPTLLDQPAPHLRAYTRETVVAEKFEAMVKLGLNNSRMKDFYDLWILSRHFEFDPAPLALAIRATFERRGTPFPIMVPLALTEEFSGDAGKQTQWAAFCRKGKLDDAPSLTEVVNELRAFLWPILENA